MIPVMVASSTVVCGGQRKLQKALDSRFNYRVTIFVALPETTDEVLASKGDYRGEKGGIEWSSHRH